MIIALVISLLAMLVVIGFGIYWMSIGWGLGAGNLATGIGTVLIAPAAVVCLMEAWMLTRAAWSRKAYLFTVVVWTLVWGSLLRSGALPALIVLLPTIVLVVSVVLTWLPASRGFFDEVPVRGKAKVEDDDLDDEELLEDDE